MYLTRMLLNTKLRSTMRAMASPNLFHGAIETAFSGERQRNLWRIDHLGEKTYLLILSREKPDLTAAVQQFGNPAKVPGWETKEYAPLLERVQNGSVWRFRLTANPVRSRMKKEEGQTTPERGTVSAHTSLRYQKEWLMKRAEKNGFSLNDGEYSVVHSQWYVFHKGSAHKEKVSLFAATYEGVLKVENQELFREVLIKGLGRGKAYGLGMMTIVRQ